MTTILVVDDDPAIVRTLRINLRARDYDVQLAYDGRTALQILAEEPPDAVLLDLGLPDIDGVGVLRRLREFSDVPVVVLSARHTSDDKVEALDLGADDYVTKPFGMEELLARIRAALRHGQPEPRSESRVITTPTLRLDLADHVATKNGEPVHLTPTEWRLVEVLTRRPGALVRQSDLLREVWGPAYDKESNYLRVFLAQVRRKLEVEPSRPRHFITDPGVGYRFVL
ncbi:MAG TPA: response regulator transcription factor [Microlunatus sp.]|nr:response regulator transcription factor [Microlunatus sp.]